MVETPNPHTARHTKRQIRFLDFRKRDVHYASLGYGFFTGLALGLVVGFIDSTHWWIPIVVIPLLAIAKYLHEKCDLSPDETKAQRSP